MSTQTITRRAAAAILAAATLASTAPLATPTIAEAAPRHRVVKDVTLNFGGQRARLVITDGWRGQPYGMRGTLRAVPGPAPRKLPPCEFEDGSGDRDMRHGCLWFGTTMRLHKGARTWDYLGMVPVRAMRGPCDPRHRNPVRAYLYATGRVDIASVEDDSHCGR